MIQKKARRIFTEEELYKFCLGEVGGISVGEGSGYSSDWADFADEDLERKYNKLSDAGQNAFDKQLRRVATKFKDEFDNLQQEIENEEDYRYLQDEKENLMYKIAYELSGFLAE